MGFVEKLKERKVFQWMAGYFAVGWGALEVLSFLAAQFGWTASIVRGTTVLLGSGVLIIVTIAWNHGGRGRQRATPGELVLLTLIAGSGGILTYLLAPGEISDRGLVGAGPVTRMTVTLPRDQQLAIRGSGSYPLAMSRDGERIAYVARMPDRVGLAVRPLDSFEATVLPDTDNAFHPFFSPDGEWVAFFGSGKLQKVRVDGGAPITITDTPSRSWGASWGDDNRIIYSLGEAGLWIVSADGGEPELLLAASAPDDETTMSNPANLVSRGFPIWPSILPNNEHAMAVDRGGAFLLSLTSGEITRLSRSSNQALYVESGHILYTEAGERVHAVPFDLDTLQITGPSFPVASNIFRAPGGGAVLFDVSSNGTFVSITGGFERMLMLSDRHGRARPLSEDRRGFRFPRISPDGRQVAVTVDPRPSDIWLYDAGSGAGQPLTSDGHNLTPVWDVTGERLYFNSRADIVMINPRDPARTESVYSTSDNNGVTVYPFAANDDVIIGVHVNPATLNDIYAVSPRPVGSAVPLVDLPSREHGPDLSPDGRWLAYTSDTTGREEVYVQAFPGPGPRVRASRDGGKDPVWSTEGDELFFRQVDRIMTTRVVNDEPLTFSVPEMLFRAELDMTQERNWDAGPDDKFVFVQSDPAATSEFQVVTNWFGVLTD
jgi:serine/threonine-protein kinase